MSRWIRARKKITESDVTAKLLNLRLFRQTSRVFDSSRALRKLLNNVLTSRAISVLGPERYGRYLIAFIFQFPNIVRTGDLSPLDAVMGRATGAFHYRGRLVFFDTAYCDGHTSDGTYSFGSVRELYFRDCYLRQLPEDVLRRAKVVVDLGANRGAFSSLVAGQASTLICVEACADFLPVIHHNVLLNGGARAIVKHAFVGSGGMCDATGIDHITLDALLDSHAVKRVDLIKIDIEGSEYALILRSRNLARSRRSHCHGGSPGIREQRRHRVAVQAARIPMRDGERGSSDRRRAARRKLRPCVDSPARIEIIWTNAMRPVVCGHRVDALA